MLRGLTFRSLAVSQAHQVRSACTHGLLGQSSTHLRFFAQAGHTWMFSTNEGPKHFHTILSMTEMSTVLFLAYLGKACKVWGSGAGPAH